MVNGALLRQLRKEHNLSAEKLGQEMNTSTSTVYRWENDNSLYDIDTIIKLAKFYNVPIEFLLEDEGKAEFASTSIKIENALRKKRIYFWKMCLTIAAITILEFFFASCAIVYFSYLEPTTGDDYNDLIIFVCLMFICLVFTTTVKILIFYHLNKQRK